ncbi:MAG: aspartyl/glutamyl-tRNA amidotransferase subunit C [Gemmatimonadetes bacterium]|nr:aspartyl/glutamyl-tRNA amidotransferase subunit C [Gemmatimonadota bacterium]
MTVPPEEVERIARLAHISLDPDSLQTLTREVSAILEYVAQLEHVEAADAEPFRPGPAKAPLRPDVVRPGGKPPLPAAPKFSDGLYLVPKVGRLDDTG